MFLLLLDEHLEAESLGGRVAVGLSPREAGRSSPRRLPRAGLPPVVWERSRGSTSSSALRGVSLLNFLIAGCVVIVLRAFMHVPLMVRGAGHFSQVPMGHSLCLSVNCLLQFLAYFLKSGLFIF